LTGLQTWRILSMGGGPPPWRLTPGMWIERGSMAAAVAVRALVRRAGDFIVLISLTSCAFEPSITPIAWPTVPAQPFASPVPVPQPSPVPLAPTPLPIAPPPEPFHGSEDLNCGEPRGGDESFGYCAIPESNQYYVWGPCQGPCPESSYPGVELLPVGDSSELRDYMAIIEQRDAAGHTRNDGFITGGVVVFFEGIGAVLGFGPACIVGTTFTLGTSCVAYLALVGSATAGAGWAISTGIRGYNDFNRLTESLPQALIDIPRSAP